MLIICNGAFKSGSTWLHAIVESILKLRHISLSEIPEQYGPQNSPVSRLKESTLAKFIAAEDIAQKNYLTKAHFFGERVLSEKYPSNVQFLFVERDLRDAIVSHYHHFTIYRKSKLSFASYYWLVGRFKAYEIWLFNARARQYFPEQRFFLYATMKANPADAMQRVCGLLGLAQLSDTEVAQVISETSLDTMRKQAEQGDRRFYHGAGADNAKLFRKGLVGEYKDHFGDSELRDIENIMEGRFSLFSRSLYGLTFTLRRKLVYR
jgi:hypothetical protein